MSGEIISVAGRAERAERLVLRTRAVDVSLWEAVLPPEVLRLSDKLARVDALLDDPVFVAPFVPFFDPWVGRPFSPMEAGPQELPAAIAVSINSVQFLVHAWDFASATVQKVIVGQAVAHADFPQTTLCDPAAAQRVSGSAAMLDVQTDPSLLPVRVGSVQIPATGGNVSQTLNTATVGATTTSTATSSSVGTLNATTSDASSFVEAKRVCVLQTASGCTIEARALRSQANSTASSTARSSDADGTSFLGLKVGGQSITAPVAPNTVITLPGIGFVILNEQVCESGATLESGCSDGTDAGHTGLTVRAIHVVLLDPASGGNPGAEVIVAEAHSDAGFLPAA